MQPYHTLPLPKTPTFLKQKRGPCKDHFILEVVDKLYRNPVILKSL